MNSSKLTIYSALLLLTICVGTSFSESGFTGDRDVPLEPFLSENAELYRFSRSAKGGLLANMARYNEQQRQQQQQQEHVAHYEQQVAPQVEVSRVAAEAPIFSSSPAHESSASAETAGQQHHQQSHSHTQTQSFSSPKTQFHNSFLPSSSLEFTPQYHLYHPIPRSKISRTVTTYRLENLNAQEPQAQLREVRVHTVPLSEAVHYTNYVVVPASGPGKAARLEEASAGSSSSSSSSSSSTSSQSSQSTITKEEVDSVAVAPEVQTTRVVLSPPQAVPVGPDCVLHRLVFERPAGSHVVLQVPSQVSVGSSQRVVEITSQQQELPAVVPPVCCVVKRVAPTYTARLVTQPIVVPAANDAGHLKEEHFHSENRSSREESHGPLSTSSSSSSSSSSSRSSKSSSTTTTTTTLGGQSATLLAPALPAPVQTVTYIREVAPVATAVAVKAAPLVAVKGGSGSSYSSVDVDHHFTGPNVKYGYSIKQQSSVPETKGLLVGDRVVYLK